MELLREQAMEIGAGNLLLNCEANKNTVSFELDAEAFFKGNVSAKEVREKINKKKVLRELYVMSRHNNRETGKTDLFMGISAVHWTADDVSDKLSAVLYLCPVEISRNARGEYNLRMNVEETFLNPALKVLLEQRLHPDSEKILKYPKDHYQEQMEYIRFLIDHQEGWELVEHTAHLALYHIPDEEIRNSLFDEKVLQHEIVSGIIRGEMDWDNQIPSADEAQEQNAFGIYPFETDSSQKEIIESAWSRKAQLVIGPAGNGKTQTEANIILEAIRRGEKVLFVAETSAALKVLNKKLNEMLQGLLCLSVIPGKDSPADVIGQIRRNLDFLERNRPASLPEDMEAARKKVRSCMEYLENCYALMNEKHSCGMNLEELFQMYAKYADSEVSFHLDEFFSGVSLSDAEDQIGIFAKMSEEYDLIQGQYAAYIRYEELSGEEERKTMAAAQLAVQRYEIVEESVEQLRKTLQIRSRVSKKEQIQQTILFANLLRKCPVFHSTVDELLSGQEAVSEFQLDLVEELEKLDRKYPAFLKKRQREKCAEMLRRIFSAREADAFLDFYEEEPEQAIAKIEAMQILVDDEENYSVQDWGGRSKELAAYMETIDTVLVNESEDIAEIIRQAVRDIVEGRGSALQNLSQKVYEDYMRYGKAQKAAEERIIKNASEFAANCPGVPKKVLFEEWIRNQKVDTGRFKNLYDSIVTEMEEKGYGNLVLEIEAYKEKRTLSRKEIMDGFYKAWAVYQIDRIQETISEKENFNYIIFQDKVQQLAEKEELIRRNYREELLRTHLDRLPDIREGICNNPEFGILQRLVRRNQLALRTIFEEAPNMLREICPCMIMSPTDVARTIPSDFPAFDLVVIDEGSQMPTCHALLPISHGKRCMIFGDEKQMQPASDCKANSDATDGQGGLPESILTAAYVVSMPRKMLCFHFRSEEESLIAFSNKNFYNGEIVTFPSDKIQESSVEYACVEHAVYDREHTKVNPKEAECVIRKICSIYEKLPKDTQLTLGVITFNVHQRNYIQKRLLEEIREDSEMGMRIDELVSVMDLASCQGQEWDYVILSPGFGKDKNGKLSVSLGALSREDGVNRLNVVISRARRKMMVITGLEPHMLAGAQSEGVRCFRDFLRYAKGECSLDSRITDGKERPEGMLNQIAEALEAEGYEVHSNIGSSRFKVDLAIVSKEDPGCYQLGILLDHVKDAPGDIHDREIMYPRILERKGWKIYRLNAINWNNSPEREIRQIIRRVRKW